MKCLPVEESNWRCLKSACQSAAVAFMASFILYLVTLAPAIPPGFDSAELIGACAAGGIAHPPGYPLYTMLGWLLCSLGLAAPALTMNVFSALCSAAACACLAFGLFLTLNSAWGALVGAFCFAFALSPWRMAVGAEVFALHLFFLSLLAALAVVYKKMSAWRPYMLWILSFILGLSFCHHHTTALFLPGLAIFLYLSNQSYDSSSESKASKPKAKQGAMFSRCAVISVACLCFVLGLLPYLWLIGRARFLTAQAEPFVAFNWGNPSSWTNFCWVVTRSGYGSLQLSTKGDGASGAASLAYWLWSLVFKQFKLFAAALGLWGIAVAWKKQREFFWLFGCLLALAGPIWALYAAQPDSEGYQEMMERFFCSSYLAFGAFIGCGAASLTNLATLKQEAKIKKCLIYIALVAALLWPLSSNWNGASEHGQYLVNDTLLYMATSIPDKAVVVAQNDAVCGGLIYAKAVLKRDFVFIPVGVCHSPWFVDSLPFAYAQTLKTQGLAAMLDLAWREGRAVYFDDEQTAGQCGLEYVPSHYIVRQGLLFRYVGNEEKIYASETNLRQYRLRAQRELEEAVKQYHADSYTKKARPFWHKFMLNKWERAREALDENAELSKIEQFCLHAEEAANEN